MITIALDETGYFEDLKPTGNSIVGGIIFKCNDDEARKNELKRLQDFFEKVCISEGCKYPWDLHPNWSNGKVVNSFQSGKVRKSIIASLPDFFNGTGSLASNPPNGEYYLYALVGDINGINYSEYGLGNLVDDSISSNRYEHMAYRAIENLLFYNLKFKDEKNVVLNLATRTLPIDDDEKEGFKQTGNEVYLNKYSNTYVTRVTTPNSYRSALILMIQNSNRKDLHFNDIMVDSIQYKNDAYKNLNHGFLYLSDIVCDIYKKVLKQDKEDNSPVEQLWKKCQKYSPERFYVWSYSDFDQVYRDIYKSFIDKDYYRAIKSIYLASENNDKIASVYDTLWFDDIKKDILSSSSDNDFSSVLASIIALENELSDSKIKVDEAREIFNLLKSKTENLCNKSKKESQNYGLLYTLYKSEMAICNHEGNPAASEAAYKKCIKYARYLNVEQVMELQNMYSVILCDSLEFDKAIRITRKTCKYENKLHVLKDKINNSKSKYIHQGRTYSQLAQCYAFKENYTKAKKYFSKAFDCYGNDGFNRAITMSYYLHMLIEQKNLGEYNKFAKEYFGYETLKEQLEYILKSYVSNQENNAWMFMLNVYMKALYVLYSEELKNKDPNLLKELLTKFDGETKAISDKNVHPWELIYKYAALCCLRLENKDFDEKEYIKLAKTSLVNIDGGILSKIIDEIEVQYNSVLNKKDAFENSKLTYMYR